jgi:thiamine biosynthesis lipoprotein
MADSLRSAARHAGEVSSLQRIEDYFLGRFTAMSCPCEVLIDTADRAEAEALHRIAATEAWRIEAKFSRYRSDNVIHRINSAAGRATRVDEETALLIGYATACYEMSAGQFDITSGVLRRIWKFDGSDAVPAAAAVQEELQHVGWHRVTWRDSTLTMPVGMEIDLGGVGKDYAVDRAATLIVAQTARPILVNFGGDLYASGGRADGRPWVVGVDDPERTGEAAVYRVELFGGGLATTGDARRFVLCNGKRLGHILDPKTGWPVAGAPHSVTVLASTCLEAGTLSTLAYLQGARAREFLQGQGVEFRIL